MRPARPLAEDAAALVAAQRLFPAAPLRWQLLGLFACGVSGAALVLYATELGVGLSPDSAAYISTAQRWLRHFGVVLPVWRAADFPPLYSALLTLSAWLARQDAVQSARWLNALLFALNIIGVGAILRFNWPRALWLPLLGGLFMLTAVDMLAIHTMAWSEPASLALTLLGLCCLAAYLERPNRWRLGMAAGVIALSWLTRYANVALLLTGLVGVLVWSQQPLRAKSRAVLVFVLVACMPMATWLLYRPTARRFAWHPPDWEWLLSAWVTSAQWFAPGTQVLPTYVAVAIVLCAIGGVGWSLLILRQRQTSQSDDEGLAWQRGDRFLQLLLLYAACYGVVLLVTRSLFDAAVPLDQRLLSPLFPLTLIGTLALGYRLVASGPGRKPAFRLVVGTATGLWAALYLLASLAWVGATHNAGQWYASRQWQHSPTLAALATLPADTPIFSNGDDAIFLLTARTARRLPDQASGYNLLPNPDYETGMARVEQQLIDAGAVIVLFDRIEDRWFLPTAADLLHRWPLKIVVRTEDGVIYRYAP